MEKLQNYLSVFIKFALYLFVFFQFKLNTRLMIILLCYMLYLHSQFQVCSSVFTQNYFTMQPFWDHVLFYMSLVMRKPDFCICKNKDADQLRGNREADQRLCFRYMDSTIPLLSKSEISSLWPSSVAVQPGLCGTWSETPKTGFLRTRLILIGSL